MSNDFIPRLVWDGECWRLQHRCAEGRLIAPALSLQHSVMVTDNVPTVIPSLDCPDCELHGWLTKGTWTSTTP
jgi:hypothetical protein